MSLVVTQQRTILRVKQNLTGVRASVEYMISERFYIGTFTRSSQKLTVQKMWQGLKYPISSSNFTNCPGEHKMQAEPLRLMDVFVRS